jgi:hypothetical protein
MLVATSSLCADAAGGHLCALLPVLLDLYLPTALPGGVLTTMCAPRSACTCSGTPPLTVLLATGGASLSLIELHCR